MNNNKCEKSSRHKKDGIFLSDDKDKVGIIDSKSKSVNAKIHAKSKKFTEISAKIMTKNDKSYIECFEDSERKSIVKMSMKMNSDYDNLPASHCRNSNNAFNLNGKSTTETVSSSKICRSCKNSSTKIIKCKTSEAQFHLSIKSKRPLCCLKKTDSTVTHSCGDTHSLKCATQHNNSCSLSLDNDVKIIKLDLLLQFLDQMRQRVITRDLSFDVLRSISERLVKDKMNIELLLLMELIIRAQVIQMTKLISKDLCQNKITSPAFASSLLKQYRFLKSLSLVYKDILEDYESTYLAVHKLSFDLISRAYFKRLIHDCPKIKEQIVSGNLNVKLEHICDSNLSNSERDKIKKDYATLKSDLQESNKWQNIDKTIRNILHEPDDIIRSLVNHCFSRSSMCKKDGCERIVRTMTCQPSGASYTDVLGLLSALPENVSHDNLNSLQHSLSVYHNNNHSNTSNNNNTNNNVIHTNPLATELAMRSNCGSIYQALENIKPPSITCSSSSNNSNGYNSCVSISSYEDSSDDNDFDDENRDERFLQQWKQKCDKNGKPRREQSKSMALNDDEDSESKNARLFSTHQKWTFRDKDQDVQNQSEQFNNIYDEFLAENVHLLEKSTVSSSMIGRSVPECMDTLKKADNLQAIIQTLMANYKKNLDTQDKISRHSTMNATETDLDRSTCQKQKEMVCSNKHDDNIKDEDFEIDFEELSQTFSVGSKACENLEDFEKFLEGKVDSNKGKTHSNLLTMVSNCRLHYNKFYKPNGKKEHRKKTESESSDTGRNLHSGDSKQTVSGDELFDLPLDCSSTVNIEIDSNHDNCSNNNNNNNSNNNNNNHNISSINNNMSCSETGSSSASTENTSNNKVCNCCKCEMFGEQSYSSGNRATNVREKLRNKLEKRKQCQQKTQSDSICSQNSTVLRNSIIKLPDVDTLVEFINGSDKTGDVRPQTPDVVRSNTKKNKLKANKTKPRKVVKSVVDGGMTNNEQPNNIMKRTVNGEKEFDLLSTVCLITKELTEQQSRKSDSGSNNTENGSVYKDILMAEKELSLMNNEVPEKEAYDPVVEDFKRFCSSVVVPTHRKKMDASLYTGRGRGGGVGGGGCGDGGEGWRR